MLLALAVHYLILLAFHGMNDTLKPLLAAKSAFVSLGTLRTLELITLRLAADGPTPPPLQYPSHG